MKQDDARKLDHTTLEEMRIRAVRSVQAGESPEVVARSMRINRRTIYQSGDEVDLGSIRVWCGDDDEHGQFAVDIGDHDDGQRDFDLNDEQERASSVPGLSRGPVSE